MKSLIIGSIALLLASFTFGQNAIDKNFQQYKENDKFTKIHITGKMFELAGYMESEENDDPDFQEFVKFVSSITSFDMVIGSEIENPKSKYKTSLKKVESAYEELMQINDHEGNFTFLIDENKGMVRELVMVGNTQNELIIFSLMGNMEMQQLAKMSKFLRNGEFDQMKMIFENKVNEVKVYPNPVNADDEVNLNVPEEMIGGTAVLLGMNGATAKNYKISHSQQKLTTQGLTPGTYLLKLKKDEVSITKKVIIQ